ncbi:MAG TPA: glutamate--cysteine ligase, partial [Nitrospirae bacterium]|nr:glutamate--cysteine ligase [Nitrospirota bacterium]HEW81170.1 glutamate--cysteine ligase [Nitrospirota bacterium]
MKKITFNRSSGPTIGVELEVQLLDPETLELVPLAPDILKKVPQELKDRIKPEFIQSMVEINTDVCSTVAEVEKDLKGTYNKLNDIAEGLGTVLSLSSIHPFSKSSDQKVSEKLRYKKIMDELQLVGRQFITQGLHVHIGVTDEEEAIKINNNLRIYLPVLLALTT